MKDLKTLIRMGRQINTILNKKQKVYMIAMILIIVCGAFLELLGVSIILPFIQALLSPEELLANKLISISVSILDINTINGVITLISVAIVIVYLIKNIFLSWSAYLQAKFANDLQRSLSVLMLKSYMNRPYSFFVNHDSGEILRGATTDVSGVYNVVSNFFRFLSEVLVIILIALYLFITDTFLAIGVMIAGIICLAIVVLAFKKKLSQLSLIYLTNAAIQNNWIVQSVSGIKDILVFNRKDYFINKYDSSYEKTATANTQYTFACAVPERIIEGFCISGMIITVLIRFCLGVNVEGFVSKMAVFAMGAFRLLPSISRTAGYISAFVYNRPMVDEAYNNIIEARNNIDSVSSNIIESDEDIKFNEKLELKGIHFEYENAKEEILNDLNLSVNRGETIGIIGESGSGKSTLTDILLQLYELKEGNITLDGRDLKSIYYSWKKIVSYVPQNVFLVDDTILANVAFGDEDINIDRVWYALDKAALSDFVKKLPDGLNTIVGERGIKFSGGQRQRIAIARALYYEPEILILDEATSALDNDTEEAVMESIDKLSGSITMIIVAHRLSTLKGCDRIYEICNGKAKERNKADIIK